MPRVERTHRQTKRLGTEAGCQGYRGPTGRLRDDKLRQNAKGIEDPQADYETGN